MGYESVCENFLVINLSDNKKNILVASPTREPIIGKAYVGHVKVGPGFNGK